MILVIICVIICVFMCIWIGLAFREARYRHTMSTSQGEVLEEEKVPDVEDMTTKFDELRSRVKSEVERAQKHLFKKLE